MEAHHVTNMYVCFFFDVPICKPTHPVQRKTAKVTAAALSATALRHTRASTTKPATAPLAEELPVAEEAGDELSEEEGRSVVAVVVRLAICVEKDEVEDDDVMGLVEPGTAVEVPFVAR